MLMQMIPSADTIGQTACDASNAMCARTFLTVAAFAQPATLSRASGSGWIGRLENESRKFRAKWTICSPEPLAISTMTPVVGKTSRRTWRMKSRFRSVAGAYWRSSLIVLTFSCNVVCRPRRLRAARLAAGRRRLPAPLRSFCQLQDRFKKSLSMSGEVGSLAGDRVVSHERPRPAA